MNIENKPFILNVQGLADFQMNSAASMLGRYDID